MGISHSKTINYSECEKNKFSDLYKACLENDLRLVHSLLAASSFDMINCHEINGSTALHLAVECGHIEIVRLLLHDYGALKHLLDSQNRTAFELTQTDEIRQLFQRSRLNGNRFCNETLCSIQFNMKESDEEENIPSERVEHRQNRGSVLDETIYMPYQYPDGFFTRLIDKMMSYKPGTDQFISKTTHILSNLIEQYIGPTNKQYHKAKVLVKQYYETGRVDSLLRLHTLETPLYTYINEKKENSECMAAAIYYSLRFLHARAFKGICFRGLSITTEELKDYRWADSNNNRYLVTKTFCSATRDITLAENFAEIRAFDQRNSVLVVFDFSNRCFSAIQLEKLSDRLPSISEFENEQEVLILPETIFRVTKVEQDLSKTTIYMTFYPYFRKYDNFMTLLAQNISKY